MVVNMPEFMKLAQYIDDRYKKAPNTYKYKLLGLLIEERSIININEVENEL